MAIEGAPSDILPVISCVPQCSVYVLGSLLFIAYSYQCIAALVSKGSKVNMFADDIALYRIIKSPLDYTILRNKSGRPSIDLLILSEIDFSDDAYFAAPPVRTCSAYCSSFSAGLLVRRSVSYHVV